MHHFVASLTKAASVHSSSVCLTYSSFWLHPGLPGRRTDVVITQARLHIAPQWPWGSLIGWLGEELLKIAVAVAQWRHCSKFNRVWERRDWWTAVDVESDCIPVESRTLNAICGVESALTIKQFNQVVRYENLGGLTCFHLRVGALE